MEASGVPSGPDPFVPAEIVHSSARTRITRLFFPGRTVIRKEPLGPDAERRVRHEMAMLERLRGVAGVAQLAEGSPCPESLALADAGSIALAGAGKPLAADELSWLALRLGRAVAGMHRRGVLHRDINPANIVLSGDGAPTLVDFALASSLAEICPEFTHHAQIAGMLEYLAPEATGRTGRPVDQRADLYALGATLYELATGAPPFGSGDPLRLIHDHLARVPATPSQVNPAVPEPLSEIIFHLLEKEPDNRYQTADGLLYDLERVRDAQAGPGAPRLRVGEHDVPARLLQPSRLVGREDEVAALRAAFEGALAGRCGGVLIGGAPGVGKTVLAGELRQVVTGADGWFVAGKFDQYRRDLEFDAVYQAFRALGRLLLAEPDDELARVRARILRAVGPNAGLVTAVVPEFAALLGVAPDPGDRLTAQTRAQQAAAAALRAVASRDRPVVVFVDDLQWAGRTPLGFIELVLSEEPAEGLLLVGAYREDDVNSAQPLAAPLSRWLGQPAVRHLRLVNLPGPSVVTMVADILHVDRSAADALAETIEPHTHGNPFDTMELLKALLRDGTLTVTADGQRWDAAAVRAHLGQSKVAELLAARVAEMPPPSRHMLEAMACLGGRAELSLLQTASAESASVVDRALAPALDEGLLVAEPGAHPAVRFGHDQIREAVLSGLDSERRRTVQLAMARRLAKVPELFAAAAQQYLPVVAAVGDAAERRAAAGLLRRAADQAAVIGDYAVVNALLAGALPLIDPDQTSTLVEVRTARHAALFSLGRFDEADEEYRAIEALSPAALGRADATVVQVRSLTHRSRPAEAVGLGLASLRELGITVPEADRTAAELDHQFGYLYRWLDETDAAEDLARPEATDPALLAAAALIGAVAVAAYVAAEHAMPAWLGLEAVRIWLEHGPAAVLISAVDRAAIGAVWLRGDYAAGYRAARRLVAVGEARDYEPATTDERYRLAWRACWFEPIENTVQASQRARQGLIAAGELTDAGYAYRMTVYCLADCAPTLDDLVAEIEAGLAFARRTGNQELGELLGSYRRLAGVLRGERFAAAGAAIPDAEHVDNLVALAGAHVTGAIAAVIFGDQAAQARYAVAMLPLMPAIEGLYPSAVTRLLRGLALAGQARATDADDRAGPLAELDDVTRWLAERAADAPDNFLHLLRLVEAERAWAADDFRTTALAFDAARREAARRQRPWHRALIAEHAARFYLAHGLEQAGYELLAQARQQYLAWGATAKAAQLDWAYPVLRAAPDATAGGPAGLPDRRPTVTTGTIDLLGVLSASQTLSSETRIDRVHARVAEVLSAMTGATGVRLLLWSENRQGWLLPALDADGGTVPVGGAGHERAVPMSVLRYAERTREPLVVADAAHDDRFARDPYFAGVEHCSLLAVPILSRGALRAVLVLENRLLRGAFTAGRLDAVNLIAGQLTVSLDNAQLYAEYRRIADEQAALRRVATLVAQGGQPSEIFDTVAAELAGLLHADHVVVCRYEPGCELTVLAHRGTAAAQAPSGTRISHEGDSVEAVVRRTGRTARREGYEGARGTIAELARAAGVQVAVGAPVVVDGRLWGVASTGWSRAQHPPADTEERMAKFAELLGTAVANAEARAELRELADEETALRRVATLVARAASAEEVFAAVTAEAGRVLGGDLARMSRYDPDGAHTVVAGWNSIADTQPVPLGTHWDAGGRNVAALVFLAGQPARIDDYSNATGSGADLVRRWGLRSAVGAPVRVAGRLWGVLLVGSRAESMPVGTEERMAKFAELLGTAVANADSRDQLTASRARLVTEADQARRRVVRDLHDGAQQRLLQTIVTLKLAKRALEPDSGKTAALIAEALAHAQQANTELRELAHGILPAVLAHGGLRSGISTIVSRLDLPVEVDVPGERYPAEIEASAYFVVAEALTNVVKHSHAERASVGVCMEGGMLRVEVRDDGVGGANPSGHGLVGLADRVTAMGGQLVIESPEGGGTLLAAKLPVSASWYRLLDEPPSP